MRERNTGGAHLLFLIFLCRSKGLLEEIVSSRALRETMKQSLG